MASLDHAGLVSFFEQVQPVTALLYNNTEQKQRGCNFDIQKPQLFDVVVTKEKRKKHLKFSSRCLVSLNYPFHLVSLRQINEKRKTDTLFVVCLALVSFKSSLAGCGKAGACCLSVYPQRKMKRSILGSSLDKMDLMPCYIWHDGLGRAGT